MHKFKSAKTHNMSLNDVYLRQKTVCGSRSLGYAAWGWAAYLDNH